MRRAFVVAGTVVGLAALVTGAILLLAGPVWGPVAPAAEPDPQIHTVEGSETGFWSYLNAHPSFHKRSPITVIVHGNTSEIVEALKERPESDWNQTPIVHADATADTFSAEEVNITSTTIRWGETRGAARYAYVHDGEEGTWVRETAQLHDGTYFGYRNHVRLYAAPEGNESWVAMQAHTEHFDWFTLRHAVGGSQEGQQHLEADFLGAPFVDRVYRVYLGNDDVSDSDGWATVVDLAILLPFLGLTSTWAHRLWHEQLTASDRRRLRALKRRATPRHAVLALSILGLVLGVRAGGLALERYADTLTPYTIASIGYPFIALGLPIATYAIARKLERRLDAAITASLAIGVAIVIDYGRMGVDALPIDLVVHRALVVVALGLIAGGAARRAARKRRLNATLITGIAVWALVLSVALIGWV